MIKKSLERGGSAVNVILSVAIVLCAIFVVMMLIGNNQEENVASSTPANGTGEGTAYYSYGNEAGNGASSNNASVNSGDNIEVATNTSSSTDYVPNPYVSDTIYPEDESFRRYFYSQLTAEEKIVYDQIYNNLDTLKTGTFPLEISYEGTNLGDIFQTTWDALMLDNPEIFYINTNNITLETKSEKKFFGETQYTYKIIPKTDTKYLSDSWDNRDEVDSDIKKINDIAYKVADDAFNLRKSRYKEVKYIHDYLVDHISYDQSSGINSGNLYGALIEGKAVCEGYSKALQYILNLVHIPNIIVYGSGTNNLGESEFHSWNYVQMENGLWYAVDATWDDPIIVGNGKLTDEMKSRYFMKGSNNLFKNHYESGDVSGTGQNFKYVEISKIDYKK